MKTPLISLLLSGLLLGSLPVRAQLDQVLRREFTLAADDEDVYNVTAVGKLGLLLSLRKADASTRNPRPWTFARYDTLLQEVWRRDHTINPLLALLRSYQNQQYLYLLLSEPESMSVSVFKLNIETGEGEIVEGTLVAGLEVTDFKVLENQTYIAGTVKSRPVVIAFSLFDRRPRVLPGLFGNNSEITSLRVDEQKRTVDVIMYVLHRGKCKLVVKTYNYGGKLTEEVSFDNQKDISLVTGKLSSLSENERMLMGNYSVDCTPYSQGMYLARLNGNQREYTRYFKFADFRNFFNYMKPARQERVRNRIIRKREKGKEMRLRYRLLIHDIVETPTQLIMVAEAYYPQYRSSSYGGFYGRGAYNDRVFDGYRYTHAVVCGFDKQSGNLLWDNSFEVEDYVSYSLDELVQVNVEADRVVLAYPQEGTINTKVIQGSTILKNKENHKILTNYPNDKAAEAEDVGVAYWYNGYFLAWGKQKITNGKDPDAPREREVFFLNKITYNEGDRQGSDQLPGNRGKN